MSLIYQSLPLAKSLSVTDTPMKMARVHKRTVPKMLIADKMVQNSRLSVNLSEILDRLVEQSC
ncbi:hypothetical protein LRU_00257 [Ligilactobacillus ruminis SPM0211]|uniref:Uncharacterized protein n=1 Tax=Ligilactobacillus ruminis SPM0211 TaxID=1040964 RepID=F7QXX2_9LACO|nr:hypothetical protein LRU_00257 [Ligilactobacillus ruminis SPM0211]